MADRSISTPALTPPGPWGFAVGWGLLFFVYVLVFSLTGSGPVQALGAALANVLPAALLGVGVHWALLTHVMGKPAIDQIALHLGLVVGFVGLWYLALIPALACIAWLQGGGFHLIALSGPALPWQLFQGLMIYAVLAATAYALAPRPLGHPQPEARLTRYLMRRGEDIRPVDVETIVTIQGADDYSEVTTVAGKHLARMTLGAFERDLDPQRFVRVHRSWIINFDRLERAESAGGGRLLAHMQDGQIVSTSRAGARALKDRLV